jgi:hypothetical protein
MPFTRQIKIFQTALVFFFGSSMIAAQDMSLLYRYVLIHHNKNFYHFFMKFRYVFFLIFEVVAVGLGVGIYKSIGDYEVDKIKQ